VVTIRRRCNSWQIDYFFPLVNGSDDFSEKGRKKEAETKHSPFEQRNSLPLRAYNERRRYVSQDEIDRLLASCPND
jgi:hypothetical protein